MNFTEAFEYTSKVGSVASYSRGELQALWEALISFSPAGIHIVEIGAEYGRSTSLILQAAKVMCDRVTVIDPFLTGDDVAAKFMANVSPLRVPFTLMYMKSHQADVGEMDFLHIDGDHEEPGLRFDCEEFLPKLTQGGIVAFHDYGCSGLPHLKPIVDEYLSEYAILMQIETCLIARKL